MNDLVWYSRFAVLVGALLLLVQSVTGSAVGPITLVGVLLLCIGFVVFITALALADRRTTDPAARDDTQEPEERNSGAVPVPDPAEGEAVDREATPPAARVSGSSEE